MPNGTAHTAMSSEAHGATPRARRRRSMISTATTMPATMQIAYARTGNPNTCQTDVDGLGIAANITSTLYRREPVHDVSGVRSVFADALSEFTAQRAQPGQARGAVGGLQHRAD